MFLYHLLNRVLLEREVSRDLLVLLDSRSVFLFKLLSYLLWTMGTGSSSLLFCLKMTGSARTSRCNWWAWQIWWAGKLPAVNARPGARFPLHSNSLDKMLICLLCPIKGCPWRGWSSWTQWIQSEYLRHDHKMITHNPNPKSALHLVLV